MAAQLTLGALAYDHPALPTGDAGGGVRDAGVRAGSAIGGSTIASPFAVLLGSPGGPPQQAAGGVQEHSQPGASSTGDTADVGDEVGKRDGAIPTPPFKDFQLGPLKLHTYGMLVGAAGLAGWAVFRKGLPAGVPTSKLPIVAVIAATLVGARLNHVLTSWDRYKDKPLDMLAFWNGGLGIYGGVAAGALVGSLLARRAGLPVARILDAVAPALLVGQAIGRFGNYFNQELYGKPTDAPWGMQIDLEKRPEQFKDRNSFHPTFAYEAAWNATLAGGIFALSKVWKDRPPGMLFALWMGGYAAGRFVVENFRSDETNQIFGLRQNQAISVAMMGAAAVGALLLHSKGVKLGA